MNFHPDKQLFQVHGPGDRTTDPWITKPALYLYTTGDPLWNILISLFCISNRFKSLNKYISVKNIIWRNISWNGRCIKSRMLLQDKAQPILQELVNDKKSVLIWQGLVGKLEVISSFCENKVVVEQTQCIFTTTF